ncbi:MAG: hypothetical protein N2316_07725 [Spirochaetes bacterium]|nr:hypothetical protein [Spirochaetota bacterium]
MRRIENIDAHSLSIDQFAGLRNQGLPEKTKITTTVKMLYEKALALFREMATPKAVVAEVSLEEFMDIYRGEGANDVPSVVEIIAPKARAVVLFALTSGQEVSNEIKRLLDEKDVALAYMLDIVASEGTEKAAEELTQRCVELCKKTGKFFDGDAVLRYSPGYCGWHVSGQKKLLSFLHANEIGITLTESFLMSPEKSISGAMIAGERKIHFFKNNFAFCKSCTHKSCRIRIRDLEGKNARD